MSKWDRAEIGNQEGAGGLLGRWMRNLVGRAASPPLRSLRLYQIGPAETALVRAPGEWLGIDAERGPAGWSSTTAVVDRHGRVRPAGAGLQADDGLLFAASPADLVPHLPVLPRAFAEPHVFDLRDRSEVVSGIRVRVTEGSSFVGRSLTDLRFRQRFWTVVTALWHQGRLVPRHWGEHLLAAGDEFIALGRRKRIEELTRLADLDVVAFGRPDEPGIDQQILALSVPPSSALVGTSLRSGSLGGLVELSIIGIRRRGEPRLAISQEDPIRAGDPLLAVGEGVQVLRLLQRGLVAAEDEVAESSA